MWITMGSEKRKWTLIHSNDHQLRKCGEDTDPKSLRKGHPFLTYNIYKLTYELSSSNEPNETTLNDHHMLNGVRHYIHIYMCTFILFYLFIFFNCAYSKHQ